MASVLRRRGRIQVKVDKREREALIGIIDSLSPRLAAPLASAPRAYDDAKLQAEYDRWVRPDIEKGREADLTMVRDALSGGEDTLPLTEAQTLAWLRAFNHLRVAAGEILGIEGDGWEDTATDATKQKPEYGILMALGYLQEELVAALELVAVEAPGAPSSRGERQPVRSRSRVGAIHAATVAGSAEHAARCGARLVPSRGRRASCSRVARSATSVSSTKAHDRPALR